MPTSFFWLFTYGLPSSRGGVYLRCLGVYLRCYRLHGGCGFEYTSGGSCGCACIIPPMNWDIYLRCYRQLPAVLSVVYLRSSVLAGRCLPAVLWMFTSGGIASTAGVHLSIPPVAPADVPTLYRPLIRSSTCGAKNISYRARYRPLANSERKAQGRKGHNKTAKVHRANGD